MLFVVVLNIGIYFSVVCDGMGCICWYVDVKYTGIFSLVVLQFVLVVGRRLVSFQ